MSATTIITVPAESTGAHAPIPETSAGSLKPDGVPDKFWDAQKGSVNVEALAKSYTELEKGRGGSGNNQPKVGDDPKALAQVGTPDAPISTPTKIAGITDDGITRYTAELNTDGKLSETSYNELMKVGYSKSVVDAYVKGLQSNAVTMAEADVTEIKGIAGGDEEYTSLITWASEALSSDEQAVFNSSVQSGDKGRAMVAVSALRSRFVTEHGTAPALIHGTQGGTHQGDVFRSTSELIKAMNDPRYRDDEAYRGDVAARLGRSSIL